MTMGLDLQASTLEQAGGRASESLRDEILATRPEPLLAINREMHVARICFRVAGGYAHGPYQVVLQDLPSLHWHSSADFESKYHIVGFQAMQDEHVLMELVSSNLTFRQRWRAAKKLLRKKDRRSIQRQFPIPY